MKSSDSDYVAESESNFDSIKAPRSKPSKK